MRGCWQGDVAQVLEELTWWQIRLGAPPADASDSDPREVLRKSVQYLQNNQSRMNYPAYRRQGMPVTTAWMESLVKEVNWRVKGTEMFWSTMGSGICLGWKPSVANVGFAARIVAGFRFEPLPSTGRRRMPGDPWLPHCSTT